MLFENFVSFRHFCFFIVFCKNLYFYPILLVVIAFKTLIKSLVKNFTKYVHFCYRTFKKNVFWLIDPPTIYAPVLLNSRESTDRVRVWERERRRLASWFVDPTCFFLQHFICMSFFLSYCVLLQPTYNRNNSVCSLG